MIKIVEQHNTSYKCKCKCSFCHTTFICDSSEFLLVRTHYRCYRYVKCPNENCSCEIECIFPSMQEIKYED